MRIKSALTAGLLLTATSLGAQQGHTPKPPPEAGDKVVVTGTVPDEAARTSIIARLRDVYTPELIVDRLEVGGVIAPPNWSANVNRVLGAGIRYVRQGQLDINGTQVAIKGHVANEARRQQIAGDIATALNSTYTVDNGLMAAGRAQTLLDQTLADRVVEFESGSAILTPAGANLLDEMVTTIVALENPQIQIVGHTDSSGNRMANIALSLARAETVKGYLASKGITAAGIDVLGAGPDRPVASNETPAGRAKNRRIEFRLQE
ncbi:OmpA family protein [Aromatoleum diolicum]|uniref:OmpA family protein n=1 Tax=Aromatoleum diolicum TaxID=75796 RepID=UPI0031B5CEA8